MPDSPVAPLDAYITAKPNEPTFTLQGGDPLAPPLVTLWIRLARALTGLGFEPEATLTHLQQIIINNQVETEREVASLRTRATAAEEVLWDMEAYQRGHTSADGVADQNSSAENSLDEKARLDLFDIKVRYAQKLSGFAADLAEMRDELHNRGGFFCGEHDPLDNAWLGCILQLKEMSRLIEPRRLFPQSS